MYNTIGNLPSVKTIAEGLQCSEGLAHLVRDQMEQAKNMMDAEEECLIDCMAHIDGLLETFGVEFQKAGKNKKSPAFYYCNAGDTYTTTVILLCYPTWKGFHHQFRIGCWGDIVEKGNYE